MGGKQSKNKSKPIPPKKGGTITPIDRATLDLKISRDKLSKYRTKLALDSDKLATRAKTLHTEGKTNNALQLLRLRKYKLQEADRVEEQLLTVLRMVDKIAEKQNEQEVVQAMKQGKNALQMMHEQMGIDEILDLMDDIRDQNEVERRINEVLGQEGLTAGEEDVLAELEQLEEEVRLDEEKRNGEKEDIIELPAVPTTRLPVVKEPKPTIAKVAVAS
jgi:charged multivesicular body protein 6